MNLSNIRIVLVNPSHPGNIGAAARAMKNMGLSHLYLVSPETFPHIDAIVRAAGADDLLANAVVVDDFTKALAGCELVLGTSARTRHLPWPLCNPRESAEIIFQHSQHQVAIVFGRERSGLTNDELALCHYHVHIPTNAEYSSLNLAAAVQVIVYELHMAGLISQPSSNEQAPELATADQVAGFYQHLESTLMNLEFLDPKQPKLLMQRLQRLFNRAQLETKELNILRGILTAVDKVCD